MAQRPTPEEVMAYKLREYDANFGPDDATPDMALITGRPDINQLYGRLASLQQQAPDFSKLAQIAQNRTAQGQKDFLGGLMLSGKGGASARPLGQALSQQGLDLAKPLRANAADIGYFDPETGEFVEQPLARQAREEKVIQSRIDALTKEREAQTRLGIAEYEAQGRMRDRENARALQQFTVGIAARGADTAALLAEARAQYFKDKATADTGKRLGLGEQRDLNTAVDSFVNLDRLATNFKPEFAGGETGTAGAEFQNYIARNFPKAAEATIGKERVKFMRERAEFWADQKYFDELPERHEIFGATLVAAEKASWKSAAIQPGMHPDDVKKNLAIRRGLAKTAIERAELFHLENRAIPNAVYAITGKVTGSKPKSKDTPASDASLQDIEAELRRRGAL